MKIVNEKKRVSPAGERARRDRGPVDDMSARTYRAGTMKEALAQVRRDLGGGAVILGTREVRRRRLFGLGRRELIEVTASEGLVAGPRPATSSEPAEIRGAGPLHAHFGEQLSRLHAMVEDLSRHGRIDHLLPDLPGALVPIYAHLLEADVPEALARRLVRDVAERLEPDQAH